MTNSGGLSTLEKQFVLTFEIYAVPLFSRVLKAIAHEFNLVTLMWVPQVEKIAERMSAYLSIGFLTILGIIMPLTNFAITWVVRPRVDPARPHITRSYLLEGYERDHSLYPRRLTTFECGSEPVGDAMIQFHFQYYWYAIIFLVFDVAFMFLVLGGMVASDATSVGAADGAVEEAKSALLLLGLFFTIMSLGVWYVFRKRGRIYI